MEKENSTDTKGCAIRGRGEPPIQKLEIRGPVANCLTSVQKDSMVLEPKILTPQRTELAKRLRREGIETFAHRELQPREDGISNTLTSVQKDNLLMEQNPDNENRGGILER